MKHLQRNQTKTRELDIYILINPTNRIKTDEFQNCSHNLCLWNHLLNDDAYEDSFTFLPLSVLLRINKLWFAKLVSGLKKSWAQHTKGKVYMKTAIIVALRYCISFNLENIDQLIFQVKPSFQRISYSKKKPCNKWIIANTFFYPLHNSTMVKTLLNPTINWKLVSTKQFGWRASIKDRPMK